MSKGSSSMRVRYTRARESHTDTRRMHTDTGSQDMVPRLLYTSLPSSTLANHTSLYSFNPTKPPECQTSHQGQVSGYFGQSFSPNLILLLIISYSNNPEIGR